MELFVAFQHAYPHVEDEDADHIAPDDRVCSSQPAYLKRISWVLRQHRQLFCLARDQRQHAGRSLTLLVGSNLLLAFFAKDLCIIIYF